MSTDTKRHLELAALILSMTLAVASAAKSFFLLPFRLEEAEKAIASARIERTADRELLVRIEERLVSVQKDLGELRTMKSAIRNQQSAMP